MFKIPSLVDMRRTPAEKEEVKESYAFPANIPDYPYGLSISLTEEELDKLNVDFSDWSVGDQFNLFALAKITSISQNSNEDRECCRVEMQIMELSGPEDESEPQDDETESSLY